MWTIPYLPTQSYEPCDILEINFAHLFSDVVLNIIHVLQVELPKLKAWSPNDIY